MDIKTYKSTLGKYLSWPTELFLKENVQILKDEGLEKFYNKANFYLPPHSIGELTNFFYKNGMNPLLEMKAIPAHFCGDDYSRYMDPIIIPSNIEEISENAFKKSWWESIAIPGSVKKLCLGAFRDSYTENVILNEGLREVGNACFRYSSLLKINIPNSVETLGFGCFSDSELIQAKIGANVTSLKEAQFAGCWHLREVEFNNTIDRLKEILDDSCFDSCSDLKEIKCVDGVYKLK